MTVCALIFLIITILLPFIAVCSNTWRYATRSMRVSASVSLCWSVCVMDVSESVWRCLDEHKHNIVSQCLNISVIEMQSERNSTSLLHCSRKCCCCLGGGANPQLNPADCRRERACASAPRLETSPKHNVFFLGLCFMLLPISMKIRKGDVL